MFESPLSNLDWEAIWSPYDETTYQAVLEQVNHDDIILEIGAGDLRLARRMAQKCVRVYAIEIQETFNNLPSAEGKNPIPENLHITYHDARITPFPDDVSTGVLLMRHCTNFQLYVDKLKKIGAERLITNARWGLGVEVVPLQVKRMAYKDLQIGWYACWCGETGFKSGPVELLSHEVEQVINEVINCPYCEILYK